MRLNKSDLIYFLQNAGDYLDRSESFIDVWFFSKIVNVGDLVGPYLLEKLSGKKARKNILGIQPHYLSVGSIFDQVTEQSTVWGAGFMRETDRLRSRPSKVYLVRGHLTKNKLPSEFTPALGDPALALSRFYSPPSFAADKQIGLILHYADEHLAPLFVNQADVKVIDVKQGVESFIDEIASCQFVFSSSLHGLIMADAYEIPNCWIRFEACRRASDFKYHDYFSIFSDVEVPEQPLLIGLEQETPLNQYKSHCRTRPIDKHVNAIINSFE